MLEKIREFFQPSLTCDLCGDDFKVSWKRHSYFEHQKNVYYGAEFRCISCRVSFTYYWNPEMKCPDFPDTMSIMAEMEYYDDVRAYEFITKGGWIPTEVI